MSNVAPIALTIAEVAEETKTSTYTLRYYERIGLIHAVSRARSGHRRYGAEDVRWVLFLRKLHATGMPIRRMLEYAKLQRRGDATMSERRALLEEHRADVMAKIADASRGHRCEGSDVSRAGAAGGEAEGVGAASAATTAATNGAAIGILGSK